MSPDDPQELPHLELRYEDAEALEDGWRENLSHGRAFIAGAPALPERSACRLSIHHPDSDAVLECAAEVVWIQAGGESAGVGVMLTGFDDEASLALERFAVAPAASAKPSARNIVQRVRAYSTAETMRRAREAELAERNALERVYSKAVWEPLLQNPRITPPEVARIARKGGLPQTLIDAMVAQPGWLASPEVRRALLQNPRCTGAAIDRVLAACSKREVVLISTQVLYPMPTRQAAKRKLGRG